MTFTSYAQNFEDVMLWRALKDIPEGFYIDVGANDPVIDSVTRAFYERGWRGINIEPMQKEFNDLVRERPLDVNLQCCIGASTGEAEIWECEIPGWTTASKSVIDQHTQEGHVGTLHKVPLRTLADVCASHAKGNIHFLKVDVEGFEKDVLEGMDFSRFRPWIVVVEATKPNSSVEVHEEWEYLLTTVNYSLAYADGLNRFYVAREHDDLISKLKYPPNVFDSFKRSDEINALERAHSAQAAMAAQEQEIQKSNSKIQELNIRLNSAEKQIAEMLASRSWRLTKPLRWCALQLHGLKRDGLRSRINALLRKIRRDS